MKSANRISLAICLLIFSGCKTRMVDLESDLQPAKHDRTRKSRQKSGEIIQVPQGTKLLSRGVEVTSSDYPIIGELEKITDGNKVLQDEFYFVEFLEGLQWVQLDLSKPYALYAILVWHNYSPEFDDFDYGDDYTKGLPSVYQDVVVQISNDPTFRKNVTTVFNNDQDNSSGLGSGEDAPYLETSEGLWINSKGVKGRYVRLYSNGHIRQSHGWKRFVELNHYIEVEVYGK